MASINCEDVGFDCSFEVAGATELDIIPDLLNIENQHVKFQYYLPTLFIY